MTASDWNALCEGMIVCGPTGRNPRLVVATHVGESPRWKDRRHNSVYLRMLAGSWRSRPRPDGSDGCSITLYGFHDRHGFRVLDWRSGPVRIEFKHCCDWHSPAPELACTTNWLRARANGLL